MRTTLTRGVVSAACVVSVAAMLAGCAGDDPAMTSSSGQPASQQSTHPRSQAVPRIAMMDGARPRSFAAPSLEEFARTSLITDVVNGTIASTEVKVIEPGTQVYTYVTLKVARARSGASGTIVARELGGEVTLKQVMGDFEGKIDPDTLAKADPNSLVSYQMADTPLPKVGDHVVVFLGGDDSEEGGRFIAARLVIGGDGAFTWGGEAPNPAWSQGLSRAQADRLTNSAG